MKFKEWMEKDEYQIVRALGNYVGAIVKKPNLEDIKTWVKMMRQLSRPLRKNLLLDMIAAIDKAIGRLSPEEQDEAEKLIASIDDSISVRNQMIARGYESRTTGPWQFQTADYLQDYLSKSMEESSPNLSVISKIIQHNASLFQDLDDDFKEYFRTWFDQEYTKLLATSGDSLADRLRKHLGGMP